MKKIKKQTKKQAKTPSEESVLTKERFLEILNRVIRPVSEKQTPPKKGKSKTSE